MDSKWASDPEVDVGAMLFTLVDPHRGHEVAYNRWYERDHFYGGCLIGPWCFAGRRWVATRELKDLRQPAQSSVAVPTDAGSYLATYWFHRGHEAEHLQWASQQVVDLYANGRGFDERTHAHTAIYLAKGVTYRDVDPVPLHTALDYPYEGLVSIHWDRRDGVEHRDLTDWFEQQGRAELLDGGPLATSSWWRPLLMPGSETSESTTPMDLGTQPGTRARSMQICFAETNPADCWERVLSYVAAVEAAGLATVRLAAPFIPTRHGSDDYTDQLW